MIRSETDICNCTLTNCLGQDLPSKDDGFLYNQEILAYCMECFFYKIPLLVTILYQSNQAHILSVVSIKIHFNITPPFYPCYTKWLVQVFWQGLLCGLLFFPKTAWVILKLRMRVSLNAIFTPSQIFQNYFSLRASLRARIEGGLMSTSRDTWSVQFCIFVTQKHKVLSNNKLYY